jgi:hypothetical protein
MLAVECGTTKRTVCGDGVLGWKASQQPHSQWGDVIGEGQSMRGGENTARPYKSAGVHANRIVHGAVSTRAEDRQDAILQLMGERPLELGDLELTVIERGDQVGCGREEVLLGGDHKRWVMLGWGGVRLRNRVGVILRHVDTTINQLGVGTLTVEDEVGGEWLEIKGWVIRWGRRGD